MNLKKNQKIKKVFLDYQKKYPEAKEMYRKIKIPATGVLISKKKPKDPQLKIDI